MRGVSLGSVDTRDLEHAIIVNILSIQCVGMTVHVLWTCPRLGKPLYTTYQVKGQQL